jgi:hypothetical protein
MSRELLLQHRHEKCFHEAIGPVASWSSGIKTPCPGIYAKVPMRIGPHRVTVQSRHISGMFFKKTVYITVAA